MPYPDMLGLILAGGASRRFGGRDKAWVQWRGRPMACHALDGLSTQVTRTVVSSNRHHWAWRRLGAEVFADLEPLRGLGPLAGIATACERYAPGRLSLMPVDAPQAPRDFVATLAAALDDGAPAAAVFDGERRQPLFAVLSRSAAAAAREALAETDVPSMSAWLDGLGAVWVDGRWPRECFANINSPADLAADEGARDPCARS